jgi:lipoate-protein ligase A
MSGAGSVAGSPPGGPPGDRPLPGDAPRPGDAALPGPDGWAVRRLVGDAACLHRRDLPEDVGREVWVLDTVHTALVLGSTQSDDLVDLECAKAWDVDVVHRRSGGGAVLLMPGDPLWVDVVLPAGDPLWDVDVARATWWLGEAWRAALADVGIGGGEVHKGALACGRFGRLVCFATLGAGEVTVDGRKLVGVSQRRTRHAARFQCALYRQWDPAAIARLLRLDDGIAELAQVAAGTGRDHAETLDAFLRHLPPP